MKWNTKVCLFVCFLYSKFLPAHVISTKCLTLASTLLLRNFRMLKHFQKILMPLTGQVWQLEVPCLCRAMTVFAFWMPTDLFPLDPLWILPVSRFPVYAVWGAGEWGAGGGGRDGLTFSPLYDFQCCLLVGASLPTGSRKALPSPLYA